MKKMAAVLLTLVFGVVSLSAETPAEENARLRRELLKQQQEVDRLSAALAAKENELRRIRIWLAYVQADGRISDVSQREQRLLSGLKVLSDCAGELVLKSMDFSELLKPKLNSLPLGSAERIRLVMALESLERTAAQVNAVSGMVPGKGDDELRHVRVMAVRSELNMAVISAGALHGVFPGMTFVTPDGKVRLRVAEARPFVSGVIPVAGSLSTLVPGSPVKLQITRTPAPKPAFKQ